MSRPTCEHCENDADYYLTTHTGKRVGQFCGPCLHPLPCYVCGRPATRCCDLFQLACEEHAAPHDHRLQRIRR